MLTVAASKIWKVLPLLMGCLLAVASVVCLVHTESLDEVQTAHHDHRHTSPSSSAHMTLDLHCLVATLPTAVVLVWLCLGAWSLAVLFSHRAVPSFPPFIPPKAFARA
jgi:hypothetical protein